MQYTNQREPLLTFSSVSLNISARTCTHTHTHTHLLGTNVLLQAVLFFRSADCPSAVSEGPSPLTLARTVLRGMKPDARLKTRRSRLEGNTAPLGA